MSEVIDWPTTPGHESSGCLLDAPGSVHESSGRFLGAQSAYYGAPFEGLELPFRHLFLGLLPRFDYSFDVIEVVFLSFFERFSSGLPQLLECFFS